jgi:hypothetical protein
MINLDTTHGFGRFLPFSRPFSPGTPFIDSVAGLLRPAFVLSVKPRYARFSPTCSTVAPRTFLRIPIERAMG